MRCYTGNSTQSRDCSSEGRLQLMQQHPFHKAVWQKSMLVAVKVLANNQQTVSAHSSSSIICFLLIPPSQGKIAQNSFPLLYTDKCRLRWLFIHRAM